MEIINPLKFKLWRWRPSFEPEARSAFLRAFAFRGCELPNAFWRISGIVCLWTPFREEMMVWKHVGPKGRDSIEQGRMHVNPVADGWAGAVMRKTFAVLEIFWTDGPTRQGVESRIRV